MTDAAIAIQVPAGSCATGPDGLSSGEVASRVERGLVNATEERSSRTLTEIVRANVFTRFNAILGTMFGLILAFGEARDSLFGFVLVFNALIGIVQEYRAKRTLDRLAVLSAPNARVVRDGAVHEIPLGGIVLDDLVELRAGDQVPADGSACTADGLELDESLLTGESEPVVKRPGDDVLSGSIAVAGSGKFQATRVGADAYARRLAADARQFTLVHSELMDGINKILRYVQYALVPTAVLLGISQFSNFGRNGWRHAIAGIVAGVVAMVPEGLVLLTSLAFGLAAVSLARRNVLVQELPAVEGLARVDVVLLDKTGTLTEGSIQFDEFEALVDDAPIADALGALAADENRNGTMVALDAAFDRPTPSGSWTRTGAVAFSSTRKWSAATFADRGTWVLGAPEMITAGNDALLRRAGELAATGRRVLLLARSDVPGSGEQLPAGLQPVAFVLFEEKIRGDAAETLRYFREQGVTCKVISGDNPRTVGAVAERVGLPGADQPVDARTLPDDPDPLAEIVERASVFGRVTPQQKRAIVGALQRHGHVVAMTGDGVNDVLALKDADIGIAMGNGAPATRAVAQLVLLDGKFSTMPGVVAEGRRVIANVERVANLFVTKTVYAMLIAISVGVARWPYPFLPRHLTLISTLTIGVPAFFLALAPNLRRYVPGFVPRVLRFALPAGVVAAGATFAAYWVVRYLDGVRLAEERTASTLVLAVVGLWILNVLARPITPFRAVLFAAMVGAFVVVLAVPGLRDWFALDLPKPAALTLSAIIAGTAIALLELGWQFTQWRQPRSERTPRVAWRNRARIPSA